jgi:biotin carboxyl carrier protein
MVVERPGRTKIHVATPLTGVVTDVKPIQGEAIQPGTLLFKIRLTHEDLVDTQTKFLQTLEELDVENREIARLEKLTEGIVAPQVVRERQYARQKLEALLSAQRQALILHGLTEPQVDTIRKERRLLRELQVFAPTADEDADEFRLTTNPLQPVSYDGEPAKKAPTPYVVQELNVHKGQAVQAGDSLCILADFSELYIEGSAFEQDSKSLVEAANRGWNVSARIEAGRGKAEAVNRLRVIYLSNEVDKDTRALHFYVALPNEMIRDATTADNHRFIDWKFKPGQRLQVRVPVEELPERIVVPIEAVAADGPEFFIFQENGKRFVRRPVHVEYQDQTTAVIAQDGSVFPGDSIAISGAHQLQLAIKNKSGGGIDPHAGHSHSH